jgi:chromosome partitioning protein
VPDFTVGWGWTDTEPAPDVAPDDADPNDAVVAEPSTGPVGEQEPLPSGPPLAGAVVGGHGDDADLDPDATGEATTSTDGERGTDAGSDPVTPEATVEEDAGHASGDASGEGRPPDDSGAPDDDREAGNAAPDDAVARHPGPDGAAAGTAEVHELHPPRRPLPRTIANANQKGGVGKTTTAVNLGAALAELGFRTLVIDLDPQGNATTGLGINPRNLNASIYDVLMTETPIEDCVEPTAVRNLFVAPATIDLAGAEIELVPAFSRELRLRRAIERLGNEYDYVLVDCPPSLGLLTINGLAAVGEVLVPIQCEYYALEGLGQLIRNIQLVQHNLNPRLELSTIVLTMYDARTKLSDQVVKEVRSHFGPKVCRSIVPRTVRLSEAPSFGQPILVFDAMSRGAIAYRELAKEVSVGTARRTG